MRRFSSLLMALVALGCSDPVRQNAIDKLGGEKAGVPPGPLHRPGQPCVKPCHDGNGPGNTTFSLGGTVFKSQQALEPLPDALVHFVDSKGRRYDTDTNCAGNFFVNPNDYTPEWPMWTSIEFAGAKVPMGSPIFREGSCGNCHYDPASISSTGHVYFAPIELSFTPSGCP